MASISRCVVLFSIHFHTYFFAVNDFDLPPLQPRDDSDGDSLDDSDVPPTLPRPDWQTLPTRVFEEPHITRENTIITRENTMSDLESSPTSILQFNSFGAIVYSVLLVKIMFCNARHFVQETKGVLAEDLRTTMLLSLFRRRRSWEERVSLPIVRQLFCGRRGPRFAHAILENEPEPIRPCALFGKLLLGASELLHEANSRGLVKERTHSEICTWFDMVTRVKGFQLFKKFDTQVRSELERLTQQEREFRQDFTVAKHFPFFNTTVVAITLAQMVQSLIENKCYPEVRDIDLWSKLPGEFFEDFLGLDARGMTCVQTDEAKVPYYERPPYELLDQTPRARGGGSDFFCTHKHVAPELQEFDPEQDDRRSLPDLMQQPFFNIALVHADVLQATQQRVLRLTMDSRYRFSPAEMVHLDRFGDTILRVEDLSEVSWQEARKQEKQDRHNVRHNLKSGWQSTWQFKLEDDRFVLGRQSLRTLLSEVQAQCRVHARKRGRRSKESLIKLANRLAPPDDSNAWGQP